MMALDLFFALVMLAALIAYALLGCADFGGGIWDLLSAGPRAADQRRQIAQAIGPVLILVGIVLRGASFVFRAYGSTAAAERTWSRVFGIASAATPLLLGICLGAISTGDLRASADAGALDSWRIWVAPFPIVTGLLAFTVSAYLAAVYLAWESTGELQEDFRRRALLAWLLAGAASLVLLALARPHAARLWASLTTLPAAAIVVAGVILAPASALALLNRRYGLTRVLAGAQVAVLLIGWGVAQHPYLIAPDLTIAGSAAPKPTLALTAMTLPIGAGVLIPSLWYLFAVFKGRNPEA